MENAMKGFLDIANNSISNQLRIRKMLLGHILENTTKKFETTDTRDTKQQGRTKSTS